MPVLGALLLTLFTGLVDFLVKYFSRTVAIKVAFGVLMVSAFGVLYAAIATTVAALSVAAPDVVVQGLAMAFPANTAGCIAACIACDATCAGFRLYVLGIQAS